MPTGMLTLLIVSAIFIALAILVAIANYRFNRWLDRQARYGFLGLAYAIFIVVIAGFAIGGMLFWVVVFILNIFAGAIVGLIFAVPMYFGLPPWTLIPYGACLGAICFGLFTYFRRKLQNKVNKTAAEAA